MSILFQKNQTILFQGDSITDCGRDRNNPAHPGNGYAAFCANWLGALHPGLQLRFLNRGISGNRAADLAARWETDCLALKPDWVSILIGVNDTWRRFNSNDPTTVEAFTAHYEDILQRTAAGGAKLILCEPFVLPVPQDRLEWRIDLDPKIAAVRRLAIQFGAVYVPFDGMFAAACTRADPAFWAADGVHPSGPGHMLMAKSWLAAIGA